MSTIRPWSADREIDSPFALPRGLRGRLAGRFMLWSYDPGEVLAVLDVRPSQRVLEVGYGPGGMIRALLQTDAAEIVGVDPSPEMRDDTTSLVSHAMGDRVALHLGTAEATGMPSASFDRVVSIHNVALWPDLLAGLTELHRVTRPGGRVVLAWHGGIAPAFFVRSLRLPEDKLALIHDGLSARFSSVERIEQRRDTVFVAIR
jgi:SAM-dependent methyltransferase